MKKLSFLLVMLFVSLICFAKNENTVCFTVNPPLVCANCENKVTNNIKFVKGVKAIKPSAKTNTVEVTYDADKTDVSKLIDGFKKIGYDATVAEPTVCPEPVVCPENPVCPVAAPCPVQEECQPANAPCCASPEKCVATPCEP